MIITPEGRARLWRDCFLDAQEEIAEKDRLIKVLRSEIARLNQRRDEFDLSADSIPMPCRRQAG